MFWVFFVGVGVLWACVGSAWVVVLGATAHAVSPYPCGFRAFVGNVGYLFSKLYGICI